jgi:hypothetical protein
VLDLFAANKMGRTAVVTQAVRELTGRPARSLREFAFDHAQRWKEGPGQG